MLHDATTALVLIDIQNDFSAGGALAVTDGDAVVPVANRLSAAAHTVILTQDWHPTGHSSFASSHTGKAPFESIALPYGAQTLWPDHCVQGSAGADFHPELVTDRAQAIVRKGFRPAIDSYSAFYENDRETPTGLTGLLRTRDIETVLFAGLATDYCVAYSALDAVSEGFDVTVIEDGCRAIDLDGSLEQALAQFAARGVRLTTSDQLL